MEIGKSVTDSMKKRVFTVFIRNAGNDAVFPTKNGSPKIMTKFMNHPYSYELLPEYEKGEKKLPNTKAMNWEGKTTQLMLFVASSRARRWWKDVHIPGVYQNWSLFPNWHRDKLRMIRNMGSEFV